MGTSRTIVIEASLSKRATYGLMAEGMLAGMNQLEYAFEIRMHGRLS
jgi:hypothetical protein